MNQKLFEEKVKHAPEMPGCYIWKDKSGHILYIGKAINLRKRSSSYFLGYERLDPKIKVMVDSIADVEYLTVDSEVEALILETNLIKKYTPKFNRLMKDDKNYSWVMIDWYRDFPSIKLVREKKDKKAEYYGPYPARFPITKVLKRLRKVFPYCNHLNLSRGKLIKLDKPCFDYHIDLCSGVCSGISGKIIHRKNINGIRRFFQGKKFKIIEEMQKDMQKASEDREYEKAAELRDKIADLQYVTQHIKINREIDDEKLKELKRNLRKKGLADLLKRIRIKDHNFDSEDLEKRNMFLQTYRMECYDISNIQGTNAVGSMVVFTGGRKDKKEYKKFKIKTKSTPDDFAMMREVLERRLLNLSKDKKLAKNRRGFDKAPNLIIVDGGKGQLSSAHQILKEYNLLGQIELIGLAKREEEIFKIKNEKSKNDKLGIDDIIDDLKFDLIKLPRRSESLYLIQRIRDEAHRFAIGYHRRLRSIGQTKSVLDDIPGIGKVTKERLIKAFGSLDKIKKAKLEEIKAIVRNKRTAEAIDKVLRK